MTDEEYLNIFIEPILKSKAYRPKFGDSTRKKVLRWRNFILYTGLILFMPG
jgi:hypothetical protein